MSNVVRMHRMLAHQMMQGNGFVPYAPDYGKMLIRRVTFIVRPMRRRVGYTLQ
jgi:hypothetical protein